MTVLPAARVLVTRPTQGSSALAEHLRALGSDPVLIPAIETVEPTSFAALDAALAHLDTFHWLLFTSANAVEAFRRRQPPRQLLPMPRIAAIGPATASALEKLGLTPDLTPPQAVAESFANALLSHARQANGTPTRFLLVRAEQARELLPDTLRVAGADVTIAPAYRTVVPAGAADQLRDLFTDPARAPAAITFTSSSTARNLFALCDAADLTFPSTALRISIGPITSQTLRELGWPPHAEATEATVASLAEAVRLALNKA